MNFVLHYFFLFLIGHIFLRIGDLFVVLTGLSGSFTLLWCSPVGQEAKYGIFTYCIFFRIPFVGIPTFICKYPKESDINIFRFLGKVSVTLLWCRKISLN
jgi:hypothetical protein